ncbi:MAG TPA: exodeoxyribonuclease V subunit alpha [bacterium]|jgi:exodeoxyribonuclease V alpha subunit|nr:exodeoxyribonuclease V subunit alpha [bacterium]
MSLPLLNLLRSRWNLESGVLEAAADLEAAWDLGHTALRPPEAQAKALKSCLAVAKDAASKEPQPLVFHHGLLQSWRHAQAEREVAGEMAALALAPSEPVGESLEAAFLELYPEPSEDQARAVRIGLDKKLALVTGGPGTGKTHTVARILALKLLARPGLRYALCAPTGKAAQRLAESVGRAADHLSGAAAAAAPLLREAGAHAGTLHRLLEWRPDEDRCGRNAARPLALDLVIVDEASMLDLMLWRALLRALPAGAGLLVLGDPFQLASIEPGRVLGSLLEAGAAKQALAACACELKKNRRFSRERGIGALAASLRARAAKAGSADAVLAACPLATAQSAEVARYGPEALDQALDSVWPKVLALALATEAGAALQALSELRVLCALNEGPWGVAGLNERVQGRLAGEGHLRTAYPVLVSVNDPHSGLFNGDLGVLLPGAGGGRAVFQGPSGLVSLPAAQLPRHQSAWAMSVHRSQGSEYATVLLVLPPEAGLTDRIRGLLSPELLYTAVTRATRSVLLCADEAALRAACEPKEARLTGLSLWLA